LPLPKEAPKRPAARVINLMDALRKSVASEKGAAKAPAKRAASRQAAQRTTRTPARRTAARRRA
jgi:non-homologous end joining protein Ku